MKTTSIKFILLICFVTTSSVLFAQSKSDKLFDTFKNKPGVTYFAYSNSTENTFNIDLDEGSEIKGDLREIRFMSYNPTKGSLSGSEFLEKASGLLPSAYSLLQMDDDENNAQIWMLGNKRKISEFQVFIRNNNPDGSCFLVSFLGDFEINDAEGVRQMGLNLSLGD